MKTETMDLNEQSLNFASYISGPIHVSPISKNINYLRSKIKEFAETFIFKQLKLRSHCLRGLEFWGSWFLVVEVLVFGVRNSGLMSLFYNKLNALTFKV